MTYEHQKPERNHASLRLQRGILFMIFAAIAWLGSPRYGLSQEFRAGAAKAKITPEELGWLGGYGHRNRPAEGVAADLWTRALALEDRQGHRQVLVSTDIHIVTREQHREIVEAVRKRHGLEEDDVMLFATHTHSGPALPKEVPFPIQIWRFGDDLTLVALSGEVVVEYALRLKKELGADQTWVVAYANEVPCYIPSERILKEGGYEAGWDADQGPLVPGATSNVLFYGWAAPLASGVEDRVITAVHSMLKK